MCGLSGFAGSFDKKAGKAFCNLLFTSQLRGRDSTGVAVVTDKNKVYIQKMTEDSSVFLEYYGSEHGFLNRPENSLMMGHARWATKGMVNHRNAHPFDMGRYVAAHNGTLVDDKYSPFKQKSKLTDSELMFRDMTNRGIYDVLNELDYFSAYAISVYEKETKVLTLTRNFDRSLYVGYSEDSGQLFWSSELPMLSFASQMANIEMKYYKMLAGVIYNIDTKKLVPGAKIDEIWTQTKLPEKAIPDLAERYSNFSEYEWDKTAQAYVKIKRNDTLPF